MTNEGRKKGIGKRTILLIGAAAAALMLSSGVALAATVSCQADVACFGTKNADTLKGSGGHDEMYGRGGGDTLKGFDGDDYLFGQGGSDKLLGGPGADDLVGGNGQDTLSGGASHDGYHFGPGWGQDTIVDGSTDPQLVDFHAAPTGGTQVTEPLSINLVAGDGPEVESKDSPNTINWDSGVISAVQGGAGSDSIKGDDRSNVVYGWQGNDTISTYGGNDHIFVDGGGSDHVDCGSNLIFPDHDEVFFDSTDTVANNCESKLLIP
jgi:Ca2+-binding RTX toxin-like protein